MADKILDKIIQTTQSSLRKVEANAQGVLDATATMEEITSKQKHNLEHKTQAQKGLAPESAKYSDIESKYQTVETKHQKEALKLATAKAKQEYAGAKHLDTLQSSLDELTSREEYMEVIRDGLDPSTKTYGYADKSVQATSEALGSVEAIIDNTVGAKGKMSETEVEYEQYEPESNVEPVIVAGLDREGRLLDSIIMERTKIEQVRANEQAKIEKLEKELKDLEAAGERKAALDTQKQKIKDQIKEVARYDKGHKKAQAAAKKEAKRALGAVKKGHTLLSKSVEALEKEIKGDKKMLADFEKSAEKLQDKLIKADGIQGSTKELKKLAELTKSIKNTKEFLKKQNQKLELKQTKLAAVTQDLAVMQEVSKNLIPLDKAKEKVAEAAPDTPAQEAEQTQTPEAGAPDSPEQTDIVAPQEVAAQMDELTNKVNQTQEKIFDEFAKKEFENLEAPAGQTFEDFKKANLKELKTKVEQNKDYLKELASAQKPIYAEMQRVLEKAPKIAWEKTEDNTPHTQTFKDAEGNKICDIKTTTKKEDPPLTVKTASGKSVEIKARRELELPRNLEPGQGPMSMTFSLKDQNGKNMPAKDALYFNANFDESGKLTNLTVPQPVQFSGEGKDAAAYVEVEGKIFTLPVSRGELEGLQQEVAKNKGVAQEQEQDLAQDTIQQGAPTQAQEQTIEAEAPSPSLDDDLSPLDRAEEEAKNLKEQAEAANAAKIAAQNKVNELTPEIPPADDSVESPELTMAKKELQDAELIFDAANTEAEAALKQANELRIEDAQEEAATVEAPAAATPEPEVAAAEPEPETPPAPPMGDDHDAPPTPSEPHPDDIEVPAAATPEPEVAAAEPEPEPETPPPPPMGDEHDAPPKPSEPHPDDIGAQAVATPAEPAAEAEPPRAPLDFDAAPESLEGHTTDARIFGDPSQELPSGPPVPPTPASAAAVSTPPPTVEAPAMSTRAAVRPTKDKDLRPAVAALTRDSPARQKPAVERVATQARGALIEMTATSGGKAKAQALNRAAGRNTTRTGGVSM